MNTKKESALPFAVVAIARTAEGKIAVTSRPNEPGRIGLPGGKLDKGETPYQAVLRECVEEGWLIDLPEASNPIYAAMVDGHLLWWYLSSSIAIPLDDFKEKGRQDILAVSYDEIARAGYGNEWMLNYDSDTLFSLSIDEIESCRLNSS